MNPKPITAWAICDNGKIVTDSIREHEDWCKNAWMNNSVEQWGFYGGVTCIPVTITPRNTEINLARNILSVMFKHDAKSIDHEFMKDLQEIESQAYDILQPESKEQPDD